MIDEDAAVVELPLDNAGTRLRRAREAAGLSEAQLSGLTKIPVRHLAAIESGDFAALPARTYAVGFARTYAKAVGLDAQQVVEQVRAELAELEPEPRRAAPVFEPGDPARVPGARLAWVAALAGVVIVATATLLFWPGLFSSGGTLPSILPEETPAAVQTQSLPAAQPAEASGGPVVFTAMQDRIWVKFYDKAGNQLLQKELAMGEAYTVPESMPDVMLRTARPDALRITIGGREVPRISSAQQLVSDVPVTAAALLARGAPTGAASPEGVPSAAPQTAIADPAPAGTPQARRSAAAPVERASVRQAGPVTTVPALPAAPVEGVPAAPEGAVSQTADR